MMKINASTQPQTVVKVSGDDWKGRRKNGMITVLLIMLPLLSMLAGAGFAYLRYGVM